MEFSENIYNFICPICKKNLVPQPKLFTCENNHSFDRAKSGYVNLLLSNTKNSKLPGDNKLMVNARRDFLDKGYYEPLCHELCRQIHDALHDKKATALLDAGCGEGYYTNLIEHKMHEYNCHVLGVDISKFALNCAAKNNKNVLYAVGSIFHLPVADESADAIINLFAPYCGEEFIRVLKPNGLLFMVIPGTLHLWELKSAIYEQPYENEAKDYSLQGFSLESKLVISNKIMLQNNTDIENLFTMTPYYYKTSPENSAKLHTLTSLETTTEFELLVYKKSSPEGI